MAHAEVQDIKDKGIWFLNSGCSNQMTGNKNWFVELDENSIVLLDWESTQECLQWEKEVSGLKWIESF